MVVEEGWELIRLVQSTNAELLVAEQEAKHNYNSLNSEANFDSASNPSPRQQG